MTVKKLIKLLKLMDQTADVRMEFNRVGSPVNGIKPYPGVIYFVYDTDRSQFVHDHLRGLK